MAEINLSNKGSKTTAKRIKLAISETLKVLKQIDEHNYLLIKDLIESYDISKPKDVDALIELLINPPPGYHTPGGEPKANTLNAIKDSEGIILSERVYIPHTGKITGDDGKLYSPLSAKKLTMYHTYVRKNQQISVKEAKSSGSTDSTNVLGMAAGADKVGTFSNTEWTICLRHGQYNTLKELNGPASQNLEQKRKFRSDLLTTGKVSLTDLPDMSEDRKALVFLHHTLLSMGIDSDLIIYPE